MNFGLSRHIKTAHLRLIHAIGEFGQLSIAAEHLAITQPAASRMLGEIEKMIGAPLFDRHTKGMVPTPLGQALIRRSKRMLLEFLDLSKEVDELVSGKRGLASIGAITSASVKYVMPAAQQFKVSSPNADIHVTVDASKNLIEGLIAGMHDFVLARIPEDQDLLSLEITPAGAESIKLIAHASHPLANKSGTSLKDLSEYPWLVQASRVPSREGIDRAIAEAGGTPPQNLVSSSSITAILSMLTDSVAIAPLAEDVANFLTRPQLGARLITIETNEQIELPTYYLIELKNRDLPPASRQLKELILASLTL